MKRDEMSGIRLAAPKRGIVLPVPKQSPFFHVHAHSQFSYNDALPKVKDMVETVVRHGQPALALTDHGNMGGSVQLYQECKKAGILPFPGSEMYMVRDHTARVQERYHLGLIALTTKGYEDLCKISSKTHTRDSYFHKPHIDIADMAALYDAKMTHDIALTTGCYFGLTVQTLVTQGYDAAKAVVQMLANYWPHTYVEVQNHNIDHGDGWNDSMVVQELGRIAEELGLPLIATQDSHYCELEDKPLHEVLKRLVAFGANPDEAVFPGDGFHLSDEAWVKSHHPEWTWNASLLGYDSLLDLHALKIPALDSYSYNIPLTVSDPDSALDERCWSALHNITNDKRYSDQLVTELDIIRETGMAGYLMLVAEVTDWCQTNGVYYQARGSASGSIVCWLLGITQADPIKYKLRFERFISRDRTKPPDIDLDVEDTRRGDLIAWLRSRFNVSQIGTYAKFSVDDKEGRGSLLVAYMSAMKKAGADVSHIKGLHDLPEDAQVALRDLSAHEAKKSAGTHAAGLVLTSTKEEFERLVPTMLIASSDTTVTQYEMNDIESLGLVKLDVLGLRTLSLLRRTVELLGREVRAGLDWIPLDDTRTFTAIRHGATDGVFQLEGWTARKGCQEMKVKNLKDIIAIQALFRPAVMNSGGKDSYIRRREGIEAVPQRHPLLDKHLKDTYGIPVFQEQVISILRDLGFTPEDLTKFLKAVKASNASIGDAAKVIQGYEIMINEFSEKHGISAEDQHFLWKAIQGFAEYGFNRAHATAYGLTAYRLAYLKTHYPLEFATALLETSAGGLKEKDYITAVRGMGIRLLRPDVNVSTATWTIDRNRKAIRKGLVSIKGVGKRAAEEIASKAPYRDIPDLIERTNSRLCTGGKSYARDGSLSGVLLHLHNAGALSDLDTPGRGFPGP